MNLTMSDPLSILRSFSVGKRSITVHGDLIVFGDIAFKKNARTKYMVDSQARGDKDGEHYYTLECLWFFLEKRSISYAEYVQEALDKVLQTPCVETAKEYPSTPQPVPVFHCGLPPVKKSNIKARFYSKTLQLYNGKHCTPLTTVWATGMDFYVQWTVTGPLGTVVRLSDRADLLAYLDDELYSSRNIDDTFVPSPEDLPVPYQATRSNHLESPSQHSKPTSDCIPKGDRPNDFAWLLVSVLHGLRDPSGSTVEDISARARQSYDADEIVLHAQTTLRTLVVRLLREALLPTAIVEIVSGEVPHRFRLTSRVTPHDFPEPPWALPPPGPKRKADAEEESPPRKRTRKCQGKDVDDLSTEDKVWNTALTKVFPDLVTGERALLRETMKNGLTSLKYGACTVDDLFKYASEALDRKTCLSVLDVDRTRELLSQAVELGVCAQIGDEFFLTYAIVCQNVEAANEGTGGGPGDGEIAHGPALPIPGAPASSESTSSLKPADFLPAVIWILCANPSAALTLQQIRFTVRQKFSVPSLNRMTGIKTNRLVALTVSQGVMKNVIRPMGDPGKTPSGYRLNDKVRPEDFPDSPALAAARLEKGPERSEMGENFSKGVELFQRFSGQAERENAEDAVWKAMKRKKKTNIPPEQRLELRSLVDGALEVLGEADNCTMQTVYGAVAVLSRGKSCVSQYSYRDVQSMLRFGIKTGVYACERSRYRLMEQAISDGGLKSARLAGFSHIEMGPNDGSLPSTKKQAIPTGSAVKAVEQAGRALCTDGGHKCMENDRTFS